MSISNEVMFRRLDQLQAALDQNQAELDRLKKEYRQKYTNEVKSGHNPHVLTQACQKKKRYRTVVAAGAAAASAKANGSTDELRIYSCAFCDAYHLTKTPLAFLVGAA